MMSAAEASTMSKSITRLLQHSILQLCNEHIGYSHKLQILGVLCMTVDDEQQELVVKVNNTLKRVNPSGQKEPSPPHLPPLAHMGGSPFETRDSCYTQQHPQQQQQQHNLPNHLQQQTQQQQQPSPQQQNRSSPNRHKQPQPNNNNNNSQNETPSGRKAHGRKGNNPVKVHQVYDEAEPTSDDEEEPITVIPEAPEATLASFPLQGTMVTVESPAAGASSPNGNPLRLLAGPASADKNAGSARRKPSQQFRVPQYFKTPSNSPFQGNQYRPGIAGGSPVKNEAMADGEDSLSPKPTKGLSLPIYVAGTYDPEANNGEHADDNSDDGVEPIELNGNHEDGDSASNGLNLSVNSGKVKIKQEPADETEYQAMDLSGSEAAMKFSNLFNSHGLLKNNNMLHSTDGLPTQVPFAMLNSALLGNSLPLHGSPFNLHDADGLTIKYTNTGPYTVGANGKDVSNSSRIKDIILYDDQSPLNQQKGNRIETDYIVDKLGMDGRKRRRRAPEDQLTSEEVAEYLGHEGDAYSVKCKYCTDEFDSVTRYIHHSLSVHQAYICHQCGKSFTTKSSLLRHRPIHTGMRRFACSICKKTFYRKDKCKAHIKRHLGIDSNDKSATMEQFDKAAALEHAAIEQAAMEHYDKAGDQSSFDSFDKSLEHLPALEPFDKAAALEQYEKVAKATVEQFKKVTTIEPLDKSLVEQYDKAAAEQYNKVALEQSSLAVE